MATSTLIAPFTSVPAAVADLSSVPNVVYGVVRDKDGHAVSGANVSLELSPSAGYPTGGSRIDELDKTVSDVSGGFVLHIPQTAAVGAELMYLNGAINLELRAIKTIAENGGWTTYMGAGGLYTHVTDNGPGVGGYALAPVNIGTMYVENVKAQTGLSGIAETPGDDPEDPNTPPPNVSTTAQLPAPVGETISRTPWLGMPYVATPFSPGVDTTITLPPTLPEYPAGPPDNDPDHNGDERCKQPANQESWIVDRINLANRLQPVGEVHSSLGEKITYHYEESAATTLGMAVSYEGGPWKLSGSQEMSNDGSASNTIGWLNDTQAHRVVAEFTYVENYLTWCPYDYDPEDHPATHENEIKALHWTGGLTHDPDWIGGDDHDHYVAAVKSGRTMKVWPGNHFTKTTGKTYKYTFDVSAFGVGLSAVSSMDTKHTLELVAGTSQDYWYAWGDKGVPADPKSHAVYSWYE